MIREPETGDIDGDGMFVDLELERKTRAACVGTANGEGHHPGDADCSCQEIRYLLDLGFERAIEHLIMHLRAIPDPPYDLWDDILQKLFGSSAVGLFRLLSAESRRRLETV